MACYLELRVSHRNQTTTSTRNYGLDGALSRRTVDTVDGLGRLNIKGQIDDGTESWKVGMEATQPFFGLGRKSTRVVITSQNPNPYWIRGRHRDSTLEIMAKYIDERAYEDDGPPPGELVLAR